MDKLPLSLTYPFLFLLVFWKLRNSPKSWEYEKIRIFIHQNLILFYTSLKIVFQKSNFINHAGTAIGGHKCDRLKSVGNNGLIRRESCGRIGELRTAIHKIASAARTKRAHYSGIVLEVVTSYIERISSRLKTRKNNHGKLWDVLDNLRLNRQTVEIEQYKQVQQRTENTKNSAWTEWIRDKLYLGNNVNKNQFNFPFLLLQHLLMYRYW